MMRTLINLLFFVHVYAQDLLFYGKFDYYYNPITEKELGYITTKCYTGMMFSTCRPKLQSDQFSRDRNLPYYNKLADLYGVQYCAQCCGTSDTNIDVWDLSCDMDIVTATTSNVYGYELRLSAHQIPKGDKSIVTCPLRRSACQYDGDTTLNCDGQVEDKTYLHGYTLTLTVQQYDENFVYWRGVSKCSIETIESDTPLQAGDLFREKIIYLHTPNILYSKPDFPKTFLCLLAVYFMVYVTLYYLRRKKCVYCQGKLVFSRELCYKCKFVGAKPPDPFLMQALEEKGEQIQGELPDRFPGSRIFVRRLLESSEALRNWLWPLLGKGGTRVAAGEEGEGEGEGEEGGQENKGDGPNGTKQKPTPSQSSFKYPSWLRWFKRWRKRRIERLAQQSINPNLLEQSKHIIFAAVGHHEPPEMDQAAIEARKLQITEALGFNPEDYADEAGGERDGESKSGGVADDDQRIVPDWQKQFSKRLGKGVETPSGVSLWMQWKMRRGFVKQRNRGPPIQWRFIWPFVCAILGAIIVFAVGGAIWNGSVSFDDPTAVPKAPSEVPSTPSSPST